MNNASGAEDRRIRVPHYVDVGECRAIMGRVGRKPVEADHARRSLHQCPEQRPNISHTAVGYLLNGALRVH
jgi:hypothetical protein